LVISNSTPLVYLAALGDFELLRELFGEIVIPSAVFREVVVGGANLPVARAVAQAQDQWIHVRKPVDISVVNALGESLDAGESEALALAKELEPEALLMDDSDGVRHAVALGLNVIRTPGIYRLAKEKGFVPAVAPKLAELRAAGFWLSDEHYRMILQSIGEV
jgi:predicted nucleic acid-binding protein